MQRKKNISIIRWNICKLAANKLYNFNENLTTNEDIQSNGPVTFHNFLKGKQQVAQKFSY